MRSITLLLLMAFAIASCHKNPASSSNQDRDSVRTVNGKIPEEAIKRPDNPITLGAIRLEVRWQETVPEENSVLVTVGELIAPGPSYSGYRPSEGEALIIDGLTEAAFEESKVRIIEVQPPLREPENEIPKMTFLKIIR